jgi:hypothetical protein
MKVILEKQLKQAVAGEFWLPLGSEVLRLLVLKAHVST